MNFVKYTYTLIFITIFINTGKAQKTEHKMILGYNFGATLPMSFPSEIRKINSYQLVFSPKIGYNFIFNLNNKWAVQTGLVVDFKGMKVQDQVKYMYTNVIMDGENIQGYFVGRNETKIKLTYLSLPVNVVYKLGENWSLKGGGYIAYCIGSKFTGTVWDGYLRESEEDDIINSTKINIENKGDASFDFSNRIQDIDTGVSLGAGRKINKKLEINADISLGLVPLFPSSFKGVDIKMNNFYIAMGAAYKL